MTEPPRILEIGDGISLIPVHTADPDQFFRLVRSNLDQLSEWLGWAGSDYSMNGVSAFFENSREGWSSGSECHYGVIGGRTVLGTVGLVRLKAPARDLEIGYWLGQESQGRGVMTKACRSLLHVAFGQLGAQLVQIRAAPGNTKSRAVAERLGMTKEATLRRRSNNARGDLLDLVVYSITGEEWRATQSSQRA